MRWVERQFSNRSRRPDILPLGSGRHLFQKVATVGVCLLLLPFLAGNLTASSAAETEASKTSVATQQSCLASNCHAYRMAFQSSPHAILDTESFAEKVGAEFSCAACHGPFGEREEQEGVPGCEFEVFAFDKEAPPSAKVDRCLACHLSERGAFQNGSHGITGMDCSSCHEIHGSNQGRWPLQRYSDGSHASLQGEVPSSPCRACHEDVFHEFEATERHRLQEGVLLCTSCHDPHEPQARWQLGGFKQEACAQCHRDKGGPFVFEHGSVQVEGCVACHTPHGSPNRHLLTYTDVADLCFSCHAAVPSFHARFGSSTQCTNCHSRIHGSNLDPHFLR